MANMKNLPRLVFLLAVFLLPALSFAGDASDVVSRLRQKYESITSVQADFDQEVSSRGMPAVKSSGRVWFKKPGKMRWEYSGPEKDLIVSDGRTIWLFQPDLGQVIEKDASSTAASMATDFLSGMGRIEKAFAVSLSAGEGGDHVLTLTPKGEDPAMQRLVLSVDRKTFLVRKTVLTDHFGTKTTVAFRNMKLNPSLKDSLFRFTPPKGSSVVRP